MRPSTRMMLMSSAPGRSEPSGYMPDERYWPMEPGRTEPPEMRRRRRKNGRFMEGDGGPYASGREHYGSGGEMYGRGGGREMYGREPPRIGFRSPKDWPYGGDDEDEEDDKPQMHYGRGQVKRRLAATGSVWMEPDDGAESGAYREVDEPMAMAWVKRMQAADGTQGPKYKPDQAEQLRMAHCPQCKKWEFFVALNMMYSDYCEVAKKLGVDRTDFYACMAKAFLEDTDASDHKLAKYMERVAK